jgi:hypothetical protein
MTPNGIYVDKSPVRQNVSVASGIAATLDSTVKQIDSAILPKFAFGATGISAVSRYNDSVHDVKDNLTRGAKEAHNIADMIDTTVANYQSAEKSATRNLLAAAGWLEDRYHEQELNFSLNGTYAEFNDEGRSDTKNPARDRSNLALADSLEVPGATDEQLNYQDYQTGVLSMSISDGVTTINGHNYDLDGNLVPAPGTLSAAARDIENFLQRCASLVGGGVDFLFPGVKDIFVGDEDAVHRAIDYWDGLATTLRKTFAASDGTVVNNYAADPRNMNNVYQALSDAWAGPAADTATNHIRTFITAGVEQGDVAVLHAMTLKRILRQYDTVYRGLLDALAAFVALLVVMVAWSYFNPALRAFVLGIVTSIKTSLAIATTLLTAFVGSAVTYLRTTLTSRDFNLTPTAYKVPVVGFQA